MTKAKTTDEIIEGFIAIHGDLYDYSSVVYVNNRTKVEIICKTHGSFYQYPDNHNKGHGCRECGRRVAGDKFRKSLDEFVSAAKIVHGDRYDYQLSRYINRATKTAIRCKQHDIIFEQSPASHLSGRGCPKCARENTNASRQKNTQQFINESRLIHDLKYDYSLTNYTKALSKVIIICPRHGPFNQKAADHVFGKGCPRCTHQVSKSEDEWLDSLNLSNLIRGVSLPEIRRRKVDGYDPSTNTVYQYHGNYWHGNPAVYSADYVNSHNGKTMGELFETTQRHDNEISKLGYNLVVMWESDWLAKKGKTCV